jgi:hypothetical protein
VHTEPGPNHLEEAERTGAIDHGVRERPTAEAPHHEERVPVEHRLGGLGVEVPGKGGQGSEGVHIRRGERGHRRAHHGFEAAVAGRRSAALIDH